MTICVLIDIPGCTAQQYDHVVAAIGLGPPHPAPPRGLVSHVAGATPEGWRVFDVWESREDYERFARERVAPAVVAAGVPPFQPQVTELHNVVLGPRPGQPVSPVS
jgi:hypothetical protein